MARPPASAKAPGRPAKIAVVRLYGLGNFILALPLIAALEKRYPQAELLLLLDPRCVGIARLASPRRRIVALDRELDAEAWFAAERPDLTFFAFPCGDATLVQAAARHSFAVCHDVGDSAGLATVCLTSDPARHENEHNLDLLRALGAEVESAWPKIAPPRAGIAEAKRLLREAGVTRPFVAMHPGCHDDLTIKRWPPAYYAELADRLDRDGFDVALVGGPGEEALAPPVLAAARSRPVDLIGKTSLPGVCGLLRLAKAMVANDSGLMHLAAAVGAPTVGIYGPTSWLKNTPLVEPHAAVRRPVSCSPCYAPGRRLKPCRAWCLEMTTPAMVHDALAAIRAGRRWETPPLAQPFVSVIVPTFNGAGKIGGALDALQRQTYPRDRFELIVVDNGSTDDTAAAVNARPGVRYVLHTARRTSYSARNAGVGAARGEILAFTDDDCVPEETWLANGAQWFEHPAIGGVAGAVHGIDEGSDIARWQTRRGVLDLHPDVEHSPYPFVPTANVFYRRAVFDAVGLFSGELVSSGDYDFAWRVTATGRWRFRADWTAAVHHHHRRALKMLGRMYFRYGYGQVELFRRHPQCPLNLKTSPAEAIADWRRLIRRGWRLAVEGVAPKPPRGLPAVTPAQYLQHAGDAPRLVYVSARIAPSPAARALREAGVAVRVAPLPPSLEHLEEALAAVADLRPAGLWLYAAGQHTRRIAQLPTFRQLGAQGVIDDKATPGATVADLPVVPLDEARRRGCRTILVSTDAYEHLLLPKLAPLRDEGVAVLGLYDEAAFERYGRRLAAAARQAAEAAVFMRDMDLEPEKTAALARGLGATVRLDETVNARYSDEFLDWWSSVARRLGRAAGSVRYRHLVL